MTAPDPAAGPAVMPETVQTADTLAVPESPAAGVGRGTQIGLAIGALLITVALTVFGYRLVLDDDDRGLIILVGLATAGFVIFGLGEETRWLAVRAVFRTQALCVGVPAVLGLVSLVTVAVAS